MIRTRTRSPRAAWLVGPVLLLTAPAAALLAKRLEAGSLAWVFGALLALPVIWILASALWPARAERACPRCGQDALERLDARATHGVACRACGFRDEARSAWLLAEEEGPLEEIVMEERRRRRRRGRRVDSTAPAD